MNLEFFGILIIFAIGGAVLYLFKRASPNGANWPQLFTKNHVDEDLVSVIVDSILAGSRVLSRVRRGPIHIAIRCDSALRDMLKADLLSFHRQVVVLVNERGTALARRHNETWVEIKGLVFDYEIAVGTQAVVAEFSPFENGNPLEPKESTFGGLPQSISGYGAPSTSSAPKSSDSVPKAPTHAPPTIAPRSIARATILTVTIDGQESVIAHIPASSRERVSTIGRAEGSDLRLPLLPSLSTHHARLLMSNGALVVTDTSTHGTWVEEGSGWTLLDKGIPTVIETGSRLRLDAEGLVLVSIKGTR